MLTEAEVRDALPTGGFVRKYVDFAESFTDANIAYHLAAALSCLTQAVPSTYCVPWANRVYANLFSMIVGASTKSRKSTAINLARRIVTEAIPGCVGEVPGSQEGLLESLRAQQKQIVFYSEFGAFLAKAEDGYMMSMKTTLTDLFDCTPQGRATANKRKGIIQDPRLSIFAGVATDLLERHTEQADWMGGFLARFLTFYAEPEREMPTVEVEDEELLQTVIEWLRRIASHTGVVGRCLWLDQTGKDLYNDWYADLRNRRDVGNKRVQAALNRSPSIVARVALLLSYDTGPGRGKDQWYVQARELECALKITNLHIKSVLELGERVTGSKDMRDRATVLRTVAVDPTPIGYIIRESDMLKRRVDEIIATLMEERVIGRESIDGHIHYRRTPAAAAAMMPPEAPKPKLISIVRRKLTVVLPPGNIADALEGMDSYDWNHHA